MIVSGKALSDPAKDELGRSRLALHLASALVEYEFEDSLVVALYGQWGTGKSTLLNFTETALLDLPDDKRPIVIRFNPWNYANQSDLVSQFFESMSLALKRSSLAGKYKDASDLLRTLSRRAKIFEEIPTVGKLFKIANWGITTFSKGLKEEAAEERDLDKIKAAISQQLASNERKLIVIIDDIDRLSSVEIRQTFQLVKALADFSNVIYLLAFDRTIIVPALKFVQEGSGEAYLEKIVNVPIELPVITEVQIQRLLIDRLNSFAERHTQYDWSDSNRHFVGVLGSVQNHFTTIRALDRLANILSFSAPLVQGEVEYADFVGISCLQATNPNVYQFVRDNGSLFVDTPLGKLLAPKDGDSKDRQVIDETLRALCDPKSVNPTLALLKEMFPKLERLFANKSYSDQYAREWERKRRICGSIEAFQTYFQLDVPAESLPLTRINEILDGLSAQSFHDAFQALIDENKALPFLEALENYSDDRRVLARVPDIVQVLFDLGDAFSVDLRQFPIRFDGPTLIMRIVYRLTRTLSAEPERFECLRDAATRAKSLFPPVQTISVEDQTANRYDLGGSGDASKRLVSDEHLDELEKLCRVKIEEWAHDGRLALHKSLVYILYRWSNWGGGGAVQSFVLGDLTNEQFIRAFARVGLGTSTATMSNKPKLYGPEVTALAPLAEIRDRLKRIAASPDALTLPVDARDYLASLLEVPPGAEDSSDKAG